MSASSSAYFASSATLAQIHEHERRSDRIDAKEHDGESAFQLRDPDANENLLVHVGARRSMNRCDVLLLHVTRLLHEHKLSPEIHPHQPLHRLRMVTPFSSAPSSHLFPLPFSMKRTIPPSLPVVSQPGNHRCHSRPLCALCHRQLATDSRNTQCKTAEGTEQENASQKKQKQPRSLHARHPGHCIFLITS